MTAQVNLGHPPSKAVWQFGVRAAEALDAAQVEIVSGPVKGESSKEGE